MKIDWKKQNKIEFNSYHSSMQHHDVVKQICVKLLRKKYTNSKTIPIYTEYQGRGKKWNRKADVYINCPAGEFAIEIQKAYTEEWETKAVQDYEKLGVICIPIRLKILSENISEIVAQLKGDYLKAIL